MEFQNDAKRMKFETLKKVASLKFRGTLEEKKEAIPYELFPTDIPSFRCCVYREREITRQRVNTAMGKSPLGGEPEHLVKVLPAACQGCPISRYNVTDNCQRCMAKKCVEACAFGAITVTGRGAYIDPTKCKECGRCASACPYNAISDILRPCVRACPVDAITTEPESRRADIKYEKCISCGSCIAHCPFGAIAETSSMTQIIDEILKEENRVYAVFAPAIEGQFGNANVSMIKQALKSLGFYDSYEVAMGGDAVAVHEAQEAKEAIQNNSHLTTSCCPAFVEMIKKHYPTLVKYVSNTISPMGAVARYIKDKDEKAIVVFIGPCVAKKLELENPQNGTDYVMTFEELDAMFQAQYISPESYKGDEQEASKFGKGFAASGGVAASVAQVLKEEGNDIELLYQRCNGAKDCKKALLLLKAGRFPEALLEGMACEGGCVAGPGAVVPLPKLLKQRATIIKQADDRTILENMEKYDFTNIPMDREY